MIPISCQYGQSLSVYICIDIDAFNEVCVTVGASQALYLSLMTLLKPSDEIVIFEPYFDLYLKQIKLIPGVTTRFVSLGMYACIVYIILKSEHVRYYVWNLSS